MQISENYIKEIDGELWFTEDEKNSIEINYKLKDIIFDEESEFQHIIIADTDQFGPILILDGILQTTSSDGFIYNEMISHLPLAAHPDPKTVLIIGGGDCGAARELTKYPSIEKVDMVEIDEMVVKACKEHLQAVSGNLNDKRVNFIFTDGIKYAEDCKEKYDIIIIDSSDPVGPAIELFTYDFYKNVSKLLNDKGIFVCQSESPIFYADIMKNVYTRLRSIYEDVKLYTAIVPTYPGGFWSFTMASKQTIEIKPQRLAKNNRYVNEDILRACFCLPEFIVKTLKY